MNLIELFQEIDQEQTCIIGIIGDLGDGKSLTAVSLSILYKALYQQQGINKPILTNTPLTIDYEFLEYYDQLDNRHNTIMLIDEIQQIADCRKHTSKGNFFTAGIMMDIRKFNNILFWTAPESGLVEKRVRNRTTFYMKPRKIFNLVFNILITDVRDNAYDSIKINLDGFKNFYNTHYKPIPLMQKEDD